MIIKNLTRTKTGTGQLLKYLFKYISDEVKTCDITKDDSLVIRHNVRSKSIQGFIDEFKKVSEYRTTRRTDQTLVHHTIISWSYQDAGKINNHMLHAMAKKYIELRGRSNLYIGAKHTDKQHVHLHIAMSGTQLNGKSSRISKGEFAAIKLQMDKFQRKFFPELEYSLPAHGRANKERFLDMTMKSTRGKTSEKATVLKTIGELFSKATSSQELLQTVADAGFRPYYRSGRLTGIRTNSNRKFRFSKLGLDLKIFDEKDKAAKELATLRSLRAKVQVKEKGFEREIEADNLLFNSYALQTGNSVSYPL